MRKAALAMLRPQRRVGAVPATGRAARISALKPVLMPAMKLFSCKASYALLFPLLLAALPARAVTVPDLYEISTPVTSSRDTAFVDALKAVVVRVSGRRDAAVRLGSALNNPRQYVRRFGFTGDNELQVGFDGASIDRLLS